MFKPSNNRVVKGSNNRINKIISNLFNFIKSKNNNSRYLMHISNIKIIEKSILLLFNTKKAFNY